MVRKQKGHVNGLVMFVGSIKELFQWMNRASSQGRQEVIVGRHEEINNKSLGGIGTNLLH